MTHDLFMPAQWPAPAGVVAGTTLRGTAVSDQPYSSLNLGAHVGDAAGTVAANRRRVARALELPAEPAWLRQVHGRDVVLVPGESREPEADASVSGSSNAVCAVLTADCLPVLFCVDDGSAVGAAHAGWRGLGAGVLEQTAAAFDCEPGRLLAWLGPAISQPSFEVGDEVRTVFVDAGAAAARCFQENARGRWQADLYGLARLRLEQAGVRRIFGGDHCTFAEKANFFSYRRDGQCGRMASLVFRRAD